MERPDDFVLSKIKSIGGGSIEVTYKVHGIDDDQSYSKEINESDTRIPRKELTDLMDEFKSILKECLGFNYFQIMSKSNTLTKVEEDAFKQLETVFDRGNNHMNSLIEISGISLNGSESKRSIVISGKLRQANNSKIAINSPRIVISGNTFGFEEEIEQIIYKIEEEVQVYLFEGERAQLEMAFTDTNESEEPQTEAA